MPTLYFSKSTMNEESKTGVLSAEDGEYNVKRPEQRENNKEEKHGRRVSCNNRQSQTCDTYTFLNLHIMTCQDLNCSRIGNNFSVGFRPFESRKLKRTCFPLLSCTTMSPPTRQTTSVHLYLHRGFRKGIGSSAECW